MANAKNYYKTHKKVIIIILSLKHYKRFFSNFSEYIINRNKKI